MRKNIIFSIICLLCLFSASASAFEYKGINYKVVSSAGQTVTVAAPNTISGDITISKLVMDASTSTTYRVISISDNAFKDCTELTSVTFKAELQSIGKSAFENCGLTKIDVPENITVINESTFAGCSSLSSITLSSATTSIGKSAFANSGLTSIKIPEGVTVINESTFSGCASLVTVSLSSATTSIGKSAFADCSSLVSIAFPLQLESIGVKAFYNSAITSLNLGRTTKTIGESAFEGCTQLNSVTYTYTMADIGKNAFKNCSALGDLNLEISKLEGSHEYVDLGLSVMWATCNVGANAPEGYGDYFAWGETTPKSDYSWSTYSLCWGSSSTMTKYCINRSYGIVDNKTTLDLEDDAAHVNWGGDWRMPTNAEQDELTYMCTWTWTTQNGVKGYKVTSKTNGNSIFLPASGCRTDGGLYGAGSYGDYWSSSLYSSRSYSAYRLYFTNSGDVNWGYSNRFCGFSVRAVCP